MFDAVALGELLIDFSTVSTDSEGYPTMSAHPGGAPANFLAAVSKYGGRAAMIGKVGSDAFGQLLLKTLRQSGIDVSGMRISETCFTTLAFVTNGADGERSFSFARKPGADTQLSFDEVDRNLIDDARVLHFGSLSLTDEPARSATLKAVEYAREKGVLISYDPNLRLPLWRSADTAKEQLLLGLSMADIVKISDDEVAFLFGLGPEQGARYILSNTRTKLVFVTCGADGCRYANANAEGHVPGLKGLNVTDTCGAGDIFGGSVLRKVLQTGTAPEDLTDRQLQAAVRFACAAAGLSTEHSGGIPSIPDEETVLRRLADPQA